MTLDFIELLLFLLSTDGLNIAEAAEKSDQFLAKLKKIRRCFDLVAEPMELTGQDLGTLIAKLGTAREVARFIGASEAFVRQVAQEKRYTRKTSQK